MCLCLLNRYTKNLSKRIKKLLELLSIMLKELVIELAVLVGLVFCMLFLFPAIMYPYSYESSRIPLPLIGFIGLLGYTIFHLKKLLNNGKTKHAIAFITILIATIIFSLIEFWIMFRPRLI